MLAFTSDTRTTPELAIKVHYQDSVPPIEGDNVERKNEQIQSGE